jgi:hypothetical protein
MMRGLRYSLWTALGILVQVCAVGAQQQPSAQQPQSQAAPPIPAYHSPLASEAGPADSDASDLAPDTRPLAGAQYLSLGAPATSHSYWQPRFSVYSTADSNAIGEPGSTGWTSFTSLYGGIDLHRIAGQSDTSLSYTAGGVISNDGSISDGVVQGLGFTERIAFRRIKIAFIDQLAYLPEAGDGFGGVLGVAVPGTGSLGLGAAGTPGLGSYYSPGESILTGLGRTLTNSSVVEVDTSLTPRSSFTVVGGYSLQEYFDDSFLNAGTVTGQAGYNYQMSRKDTIAVSYLFSAIRYSNFDQPINTHNAFVSYGRRVTGKLAFQVSGGPAFTTSLIPIPTDSGTVVTLTAANSNTTQIFWTLNASLQYQLRRAGLAANYSHWVSAGSGILAGAITDTASGTITRQLSRTTGSGINFGYSRNTGVNVVTLNGAATAPSSQTYEYWFAGANLSHPWGRTMSLNLSYQFQYQDSSTAFCIGPACGANFTQHLISFGLGWNSRLIPF